MTYQSTVLSDAPNGYWRLGEPSGAQAIDSSGNGLTGTYIANFTLGQPSLIPIADPTNTAVAFIENGTGMAVPNNALLNIGDVVTLEAWIKLSALPSVQSCIIGKGANAYIMRINGTGHLEFLASNNALLAQGTPVFATGAIHHCVCTKNGAAIHTYVDGVDVSSSVANTTLANNAQSLSIGGPDSGANAGFPGVIDEPAVYPTALSAARVLAHYTAGITAVATVASGGHDLRHIQARAEARVR
jgi:Concanavalin A-like lectin/glucanases superfamily